MLRTICTCLVLFGLLASCGRHNGSHDLDQQLLEACRKGEINRVDGLLNRGAQINARNEGGSTSLSLAVDFGHTQIAELLIKRRASLPAAGLDGDDALVEAARGGFVHRTEFLLRRNANTPTKNEALFAAAENAPAVINVAIAQQTTTPPEAENPATVENGAATAAVLLTAGANLESRDEEGATPLIRAAEFGNTEVVKYAARPRSEGRGSR